MRVNSTINLYDKTEANIGFDAKKKIQSIVKELTENYAAIQAHYQSAYLLYWTNPCSKENEEKYAEATKDIRERDFFLRKLQINAENLVKNIEISKKEQIKQKAKLGPEEEQKLKLKESKMVAIELSEAEKLVSKLKI